MVDAQFTTTRILKPFAGFERVYQGKASSVPIAFPGVRDERAVAGDANIDPNLLAAYPVPLGSRVLLQFPICVAPNTDTEASAFQFYSYTLIWRFRNASTSGNVAKARRRAVMGHMPNQDLGDRKSVV